MRRAAVIVAMLAFIATMVGMLIYWLSTSFLCFDVCPSVGSAIQLVVSGAVASLAPGVILSFAAWVLCFFAIRGQRRVALLLTLLLVTPVVVVLISALMLFLAGGSSFAPVAAAGGETLPPAQRQVTAVWVSSAAYSAGPLLFWPVVSLVVALLTAPRSRG
jgi:hypothetical protein